MNMKIDQHTDPMAYQPDMEITSSAIMEQVLAARAAYDETVYTADDVKQALLQDHLTPEAFAALLAPAAAPFLEQLAQRAQAETRKHFGNVYWCSLPAGPQIFSCCRSGGLPHGQQ